MATDKRFVVKNGLQTENINFVFNDAVVGSSNITATMLSSNVLSFSGTSGQLFSIADTMTGVIFSVNDISGVPSIEVYDDGRIRMAESFGNVIIGNSTINTSRTSTSTTTGILQVAGGAGIVGNINVGGTNSIFSGNVGIGTSFARTPLDIRGTTDQYSFQVPTSGSARYVRAQPGLASFAGYNLGLINLSGTFDNFDNVYNGAMLGALNSAAWTASSSPAHMTFLTTPTGTTTPSEKMRLTSAGNLLIAGTTAPAGGNAQVLINSIGTNAGGLQIAGGAAGGSNIYALNGGGLVIGTYTGAVGSETYTERMRLDSAGNIGIGTSSITAGTRLMVAGGAEITGNINVGGVNSYFGGNVGIGTNNAAQLEVYNATSSMINLSSSGTFKFRIETDGTNAYLRSLNSSYQVHSTLLQFDLNQSIATFGGPVYINNATLQLGSNSHRILASTNDLAIVHTQSSLKGFRFLGNVPENTLVMNANAAVGIGTTLTLAGSKLTVVGGNVNLSPTGIATGYGIVFPDGTFQTTASSAGAASSGIAGTVQFSGGSGTFAGDAANFFWDDTNNRLGIGTSAPSNTLSAWGATPAWFNTTNGANVIEVIVGNTTATSTTVGYSAASSPLAYGYISATASSVKNITFNSSGYTGIGGATQPKNALDVAGAMVVGATYAGTSAYSPPANSLAVQNRVGVGTSNPLSSLDVNGWAGFRQGLSAAGAVTVASLTSNGAVSGTTGTFSDAIYGASFNTAGTAIVNVLVSNVYGLFGQNVTINSTNASTSTTTGALILAGGAGIAGNVYAGGNVVAASFQPTSASVPGTGMFRPAANTLGFSTSGTEYARISSTGRVGIGSTSPAAALDVSTNGGRVRITQNTLGSTLNGMEFASYDGAINGGLLWNQNNGEIRLNAASTYYPTFYSSGSERMRIDTNGNVGIGATSPTALLEVRGTGLTPDAYIAVTTPAGGGGARKPALLLKDEYYASQGGLTGSYVASVRAGLDIEIASSSTNTYTNRAKFLIGGGNTRDFSFLGSSDSGANYTEYAKIDNSGNFGIGVTTPALQSGGTGIHIHGTSYSEIKFTNGTTGNLSTDGTALVTNGSSFAINNREAGEITFGTSNLERVRISAAGDFGIGTTSPSAKLDVASAGQGIANMRLLGPSVDNNWAGGIRFYSFDATTVRNEIVNNTGGMQFYTANAERVRITAAGDVGIGTTAPSDKFTVIGRGFFNSGVRLGTGYSALDVATGASGLFLSGSQGALNHVFISPSGSVGIGTTTPGSVLDVSGNASFRSAVSVAGKTNVHALTSNTGITVSAGGITVTGLSTFTGNVGINGNLTVTGTINTQNANVLVVNDPIIYLGEGNTSNLWDLGIIANYNDGVYEHTGLVRNRNDGIWTLFDNMTSEPNVSTGNINWADSTLTFAPMKLGNLTVVGNTRSTTSSTGAIVLSGLGGIGVGGNIYVGGQQSGISGNLWINGSNTSASSTTGALVVAGGVGIGGNLYVNGTYVQVKNYIVSAVSGELLAGEDSTGVYFYRGFGLGQANRPLYIGSNQGNIVLSTNVQERVRITNSGFVGIGTTAPSYKLQVEGGDMFVRNISSAGRVYFPTNGVVPYIGTTTNQLGIEYGSYNLFFTRAGGTDVMTLGSTGNVGIGTTAPAAKFHVQGTAGSYAMFKDTLSYYTTSAGGLELSGYYSNKYGIYVDNSGYLSIGYNNTGNALVQIDGLGNLTGIGGARLGYANYSYAPGFTFVSDASSGMFSPGVGSLGFSTVGTERVRIDLSGNVGIGSAISVIGSAYVRDLTVNASIQTAGTLTVNALVSNVYGRFGQNVTVNSTNASTSTSTGALIVAGGAGIGGNINVGGTVNTFTGLVGIGTTAPSEALHLFGSGNKFVKAQSTTNAGAGLWIENSTGWYKWQIDSARTFSLTDSAGPNRIFVANNGNLGFGDFAVSTPGTAYAPKAKLDVAGALAVGYALTDTFTAPANGAVINGSVGIGTTSPGGTLQVVGTLWAGTTSQNTGPSYGFRAGGGSNSYGEAYVFAQGTYLATYSNPQGSPITGGAGTYNVTYPASTAGLVSGQAIAFSISNTERMRITTAGDVGIGTTVPFGKLDVAGTIFGKGGTAGAQFDALTLLHTPFANGNTVDAITIRNMFNDTVDNPIVATQILTGKDDTYQNPPSRSAFLAFHTRRADTFSERMRISSFGNLLIGTTTRASSASSTIVVQGSGTNGSGIQFSNVNVAGVAINTGGSNSLVFSSYTGAVGSETYSERARLTSDGNFLVGLTSSGDTSAGGGQFSGPLMTSGALNTSQTNRAVLQYTSNEASLRSYGASASTGYLTFRTGGGGGSGDTERMRIAADGKVGIGASNPAYTLHVDSASDTDVYITSSVNAAAGLRFAGAGYRGRIYTDSSYNMYIEPNAQYNNPYIIMKAVNDSVNSVRVGIGTATPVDRLHVYGDIGIHGFPNSSRQFNIWTTHGGGNIVGYHRYNVGAWGTNLTTWLGRSAGGSGSQNAIMQGVWDDPSGYPNQNTLTSLNTTALNTNAVLYVGHGSNVAANTLPSLYLERGAILAASSGNVMINSTNASISTTTGALVLAGGIGLGGNINAGGTNHSLQGNVGIGTLSPVTQLHITTDNGSLSNRGLTIDQHNTGVQAALANFRKSRGTLASPTTVANGDYTGVFTFQNYDGSAYRNNAGFGARINGTVASNSVPTDLYFWAGSTDDADPYTNNTVRMVISSNGRVGIGTASPAQRLHVFAAAGTVAQFTGGTDSGAIFASGGLVGLTDTAGTNGFIFNSASNYSYIQTNGSEKMRVTSAGSVGIGSSIPVSTLDVAGTTTTRGLRSQTTNLGQEHQIEANGTNGAYNAGIMLGATNTNNRGLFKFQVDVGNLQYLTSSDASTYAERMRITQAGLVGIGTTTPTLQVDTYLGTVNNNTVNFGYNAAADATSSPGYAGYNLTLNNSTANATGFIRLARTASTAYLGMEIQSQSRDGIRFLAGASSPAERMRITDVGKVGIGSTIPAATLDVNGDIAASGDIRSTSAGANQANFQAVNTSNTAYLHMIRTGYQAWYIASPVTSSDLYFAETSNSTANSRLYFKTGGNIGIGTTNPSAKLSVTGGAIRVDNTIGFGATFNNTSAAGMYVTFSDTINSSAVGTNNGSMIFYNNTNTTERMRIDSSGNVGIGTNTITTGYKLQVRGGFAATTKSFVIDHPTKPGMMLRYGSLEGGENGVYVRGRTKTNVIELPDHWTGLVDENSITVSLTAIGRKQELYVKEIKDNKIIIGGTRDIDCFYTVFGERKDVEKLVVEF